MLKVLYLPLNSGGVQRGMYDAWNSIRLELEIFDFFGGMYQQNGGNKPAINQQLIERARIFQPDLIHMQLQITNIISAHTLRQIKQMLPNVMITNWSGDIRATPIQELLALKDAVDYTLISSTGQLELYRQIGCHNIKYWQIGYYPKQSYPLHYQDFKYDISFIANNYHHTFPDGPTRLQAVNQCIQAFGPKFGLFGMGWPKNTTTVDSRDSNEVYNKSVCALSISNFNGVSHYFSDRLLYCLASGRPTISWYFPGAESYFIEGQEIFYARNVNDIVDIVEHCKRNPELATQVGINGYQKVLKEHTYTSRIIELLHMTKMVERL